MIKNTQEGALSSFQKLEAHKNQWLEELTHHPLEKLYIRPASGVWSVLDIVNHLIVTEDVSLRYVKKKLSFDPDLKEVDFGTNFRLYRLKLLMLLPLKIKAPSAVDVTEPGNELHLDELSSQWRSVREQLKAFLTKLPTETYTKEVYKHPFSGRIPIAGMMFFHELHFERHKKQAEKLLIKLR